MKDGLSVFAVNCTLKRGNGASSTDHLLKQVLAEFKKYEATHEIIRAVNHDILPGVTSDEGKGDGWPEIHMKLLAADIILIGTPVWMGHPSSVCQRVLERMDALLSEKDEQGRLVTHGKVAVVAIVGNEDGAHHISANVFQGLNDVGFTIPANGVTYWVGEAMGSVNYIDLPHTPRKVTEATEMLVRNAVHLAKLLKHSNYKPKE